MKNKKHSSDVHRLSFKSKYFEEYDIDIDITYYGVHVSDLHTIYAGRRDPDHPVVISHEIACEPFKVGANVEVIKVSGRVGVSTQA